MYNKVSRKASSRDSLKTVADYSEYRKEDYVLYISMALVNRFTKPMPVC